MSLLTASVIGTGSVWGGTCVMAGASNQNLFRSNGYVGREIRRRRAPECSASHFGCNPPAQSEPTERSRSIELCSPYDASPKEETMVTGFCELLTASPFFRGTCCLARVLSTLPGPTSTKTAPLLLSNSCTPGENCTGARRRRAQYLGSVASFSEIQVPETQQTNGTCRERRRICSNQ